MPQTAAVAAAPQEMLYLIQLQLWEICKRGEEPGGKKWCACCFWCFFGEGGGGGGGDGRLCVCVKGLT